MARCVCGHKKKHHGKAEYTGMCFHINDIGDDFCDCDEYREDVTKALEESKAALGEPVGVDLLRVSSAIRALNGILFGIPLSHYLNGGEITLKDRWVAAFAASKCPGDEAFLLAIEAFVSSVKVGDYDLHLET